MDDITKYIMEQEEVNKMIEESKNEFELREISNVWGQGVYIPKGQVALAGSALAAMIIWKVIKVAARVGDPKQCKDYKLGTPSYKLCLRKAKKEKLQKQIQMLKSKINLCNQAKKNPEKCKVKIQQKIIDLESKIKAVGV